MHWDIVEVKPEPHYRFFVRLKDGVAEGLVLLASPSVSKLTTYETLGAQRVVRLVLTLRLRDVVLHDLNDFVHLFQFCFAGYHLHPQACDDFAIRFFELLYCFDGRGRRQGQRQQFFHP